MSAFTELLDCYQQWRHFTLLEGESIRIGEWTKVSEYQGAKQRLQKPIIKFSETLEMEFREFGLQKADAEQKIRSVIAELVELEKQNAVFIADQREACLAKQMELEQSSGNLKRIQQRYSRPSSSAWYSFS